MRVNGIRTSDMYPGELLTSILHHRTGFLSISTAVSCENTISLNERFLFRLKIQLFIHIKKESSALSLISAFNSFRTCHPLSSQDKLSTSGTKSNNHRQ